MHDDKTGRFAPAVSPEMYLLSKIEKNEITGCWNWKGSCFPAGYGYFKCKALNHNPMTASRASWLIHKGPIESGSIQVCHACDNRKCCNPDHLFLGTHQANTDDCIAKKRHSHGVKRPQAKLTDEIVSQILWLNKHYGWGYVRLAQQYDYSKTGCQLIIAGNSWKHVSREEFSQEVRDAARVVFESYVAPSHVHPSYGKNNAASKLTEDDVVQMRRLRAEGQTVADIARQFNITVPTAHNAVTLRTWSQVKTPHDDYIIEHRAELTAASHGRKALRFGPGHFGPKSPARGAANGSAKLTEDAVREIREMYAAGVGPKALSEHFHIDKGTIYNIISGKQWGHVT